MILILEGSMGSGKTTLARALIEHHGFKGFRMFHPIRPGGENTHMSPGRGLDTGGVERFVPTNIWVEDIYAAEVMYQLKPDRVVIDRSFISGVAWDAIVRPPWNHQAFEVRPLGVGISARPLTEWWARRMNRAGGVLVHMAVPLDVAVERCRASGRFPGLDQPEKMLRLRSRVEQEQTIIAEMCDYASNFMPNFPVVELFRDEDIVAQMAAHSVVEEAAMVTACELLEDLSNTSGGNQCLM